jgi:ferredoxin
MIRVEGREEPVPSSPAISILVLLQRAAVPIHTVCGGRAQCGRCLIQILEGSEKLNRPLPAETFRLKALQAGPGYRLACQSYARGDVRIRIVNPRGAENPTAGGCC